MKLYIKNKLTNIIILFLTISAYSQYHMSSGIDQLPPLGQSRNATVKVNLDAEKIDTFGAEIYLFSNYENKATITTTGGRKYSISNINLNIYSNTFDSKMSKDSIYVFDNHRIESVKITDKLFKIYFNKKDSKYTIYRVLFENEKISLLCLDKIYSKEIRDPLNINPPKIKYVNGVNYYLKNNSNFDKISLKKKSILKILNDKKSGIIDYVKKYNLSFNKEKDVQKIFKYYNSI